MVIVQVLFVLLAIVLLATGLWLLRKDWKLSFAYYRRYEPWAMVGLVLILIGLLILVLVFWPSN